MIITKASKAILPIIIIKTDANINKRKTTTPTLLFMIYPRIK